MSDLDPANSRDLSRIPTASALREPILEALRAMGGKASNADIERQVADRLGVSADDFVIPHDPCFGTRTEFAYRMAWARTRLKKANLIDNVGPKTWALTPPAEAT